MERVALFQVSGHFWRASITHTHYSSGYRVGNLTTRWEWADPGICFLCWQWMSWWFDFSLRAGSHLQTVLQLPGITSSSVIGICVFLRDCASSGQCRLGRAAVFPIKTLSLRTVKSDLQASAYDLSVPCITGRIDYLAFFQKTFVFW